MATPLTLDDLSDRERRRLVHAVAWLTKRLEEALTDANLPPFDLVLSRGGERTQALCQCAEQELLGLLHRLHPEEAARLRAEAGGA
jgi:hypothetical protein